MHENRRFVEREIDMRPPDRPRPVHSGSVAEIAASHRRVDPDHDDPYSSAAPITEATPNKVAGTIAVRNAVEVPVSTPFIKDRHSADSIPEPAAKEPKNETVEEMATPQVVTGHHTADKPEETNGGTDVPADPPVDESPAEGIEVAGEPEPNVDIYETEKCRILVSREHGDPRLAERLQEEDGDFSSWSRPEDTPSWKKHYQDDPDDPTYYAKVRTVDSMNKYNQHVRDLIAQGRATKEHISQYAQIQNSLADPSQEFLIADEVERTLATPEARQIVTTAKYTFASIGVVKPVAAVENRQTGDITVVYPMQNGRHGLQKTDESEGLPPGLYNSLKSITKQLWDVFQANGIQPNDLTVHQWMIETDGAGRKHLRLIDLEQYYYLRRLQS
jgi:hypothetical protein